MRSLLVQLLVSFIVVIAVGVGSIAYIAQRSTDQEFQTYVQGNQQTRTARVVASLSAYYAGKGSWDGVGAVVDALSQMPVGRLVLVDTTGNVAADSAHQWTGKPATGLNLSDPTPITANGSTVGSLYLDSATAGRGMGRQGGRGQGPPWLRAGQSTAETTFLDAVQQSLITGGLAAGGVALLLGLLLSWRVVRPLRMLTAGARKVAHGDLSHRVKVRPGGEVGELASAFDSMAESLERNEAARRNLLADVAHELKTPLTVIEGNADGILDGVFEPTKERIGVIKDEAALLAKLIADLRELSLAEAGRLVLERKPVDMSEVAIKALDASDASARLKSVELALEAEPRLPLVDGDESRLGQVIRNLLSNAVRHTPAGGKVTIELSSAASPARVVLNVIDTGEGIPAEDLPHVFDRFYRADPSRARRSGGTGLGLAIVKHLVEAHGGQVSAQSMVGAGSTFTVSLPAMITRTKSHGTDKTILPSNKPGDTATGRLA